MSELKAADVRPGGWKSMLQPRVAEGKEHKGRHVPAVIDEQIVKDVSNGQTPGDIEQRYALRDGYVRDTLVRKFGSIDAMKRALQLQCLENAIVLNEHAMDKIAAIAPGQALVGAKIMIDGALALEKSRVDKPATIDFEMLAALGGMLERVERRVAGTDRTMPAS